MDFVKTMVIQNINKTCPLAAADFNHCCAVHDDCYENQRGRDHCDKQFCGCLEYQVSNDPEAAKCGRNGMTKMACDLVHEWGGTSYDVINKTDGPLLVGEESSRIPEEISRISKEFEKIYEKCPEQRATFGSCGLNFDLCYRNPSPSEPKHKERCTLNLLRCLDDSQFNRNTNKECDQAIEETLLELIDGGDHKKEKEEGSGAMEKEGADGEKQTENLEGRGGDTNVLLMQGIVQNKTLVQKIYLQVVRTSSSISWIVYFCFFFSCFLCCIILIVGIVRNGEENRRRRHQNEEIINVHVSSTNSGSKKSTASSTSESEKTEKSSKK